MNIKTKLEDLKKELLTLESIKDESEKNKYLERVNVLKKVIELRSNGYDLIKKDECDHSQFGLLNKPLLYLSSSVEYGHKTKTVFNLACLECNYWLLECYKSHVDEKYIIGLDNPLKDEYKDIYTIEQITIISGEYDKLVSNGLSNKEIVKSLKNKFEEPQKILIKK